VLQRRIHRLQAAQVEEQRAVVGRLDDRADVLQRGQERLEHRRAAHRVGLQDDGIRAEWHDLAQRQTRLDAHRLGLGRAQLDDFALARRAAQDERPAIPGRVAQDFDAQRELGDPDAGDANGRPGAHCSSIERVF
jgi:hypothetical protein